MPKPAIAQLPTKLYKLLSPLRPDERARVVQATMILFGEDAPAPLPASHDGLASRKDTPPSNDAGAYFDEKEPKNKGETLAVAARFLEQTAHEETHSKADLKAVITSARRNFDDNNFARDMDNAKRHAGFFNLGTGRDASKLSYYGQQYVDALPDREAALKLRRPKVGGGKKRTSKKKAPKK